MERLPVPHGIPCHRLHTTGDIGQILLGTKGVGKPCHLFADALQFRLQFHKLLLIRSGEDSLCFQLPDRSLYSGALLFEGNHFIVQGFIAALHTAAANLFRQASLIIPLDLLRFQLQFLTAGRHFPFFIPEHGDHFHIQLFLMGKRVEALSGKFAVQGGFVGLANRPASRVLQRSSRVMLDHCPGDRSSRTYVVSAHGDSGDGIVCRHDLMAGIYDGGMCGAFSETERDLPDLDAIDSHGIHNPLQMIPPGSAA